MGQTEQMPSSRTVHWLHMLQHNCLKGGGIISLCLYITLFLKALTGAFLEQQTELGTAQQLFERMNCPCMFNIFKCQWTFWKYCFPWIIAAQVFAAHKIQQGEQGFIRRCWIDWLVLSVLESSSQMHYTFLLLDTAVSIYFKTSVKLLWHL